MNKYFTIKEMANQLGVTTNKLRYYESAGLIEPHTNDRTGYRYYSVLDTRRFNASRLYRAFGLSINECKELMGGLPHSELVTALERQEEAMGQKISYEMDKLLALSFWKPYISNVLLDVDRAHAINFPTVYRIVISHDEKRIRDEKREHCFQKWIDVFPITSWASRIKKEKLNNPGAIESYDYGLIVTEPYLQKYGLYDEEFVECIPGGTYCYTVFEKNTGEPFSTLALFTINDYLAKNDMHITGDAFSNCIYSTKRDGQITNYHYFMVKCSK